MRTETIIKKIYTFDELPEATQEKAIEKLHDINVEFDDWAEFTIDSFREQMEEIGVTFKRLYFDLGRSQICYMDGASVDDWRKFVKSAHKNGHKLDYADLRNVAMWEGVRIGVQCCYVGNSAANYCETETACLQEYTDFIRERLGDALTMLQEAYDYSTSETAIKESIEANEWEFDEEGNLA